MDNTLQEMPSHYEKSQGGKVGGKIEIAGKKMLPTAFFAQMPKQCLVYGCKGTGKTHFLMQYALWLLAGNTEKTTLNNTLNDTLQNISTNSLRNQLYTYQKNEKIEILHHYPDYLQNFFIEKTLKPLLQKAYQSYQDFFVPKKINPNNTFLLELQDFLSKNMRLDTEEVEIFLPNVLSNTDTNIKKKTKKPLSNTQQNIEKIVLLGIENNQLLYELYAKNQQATNLTQGFVHYVGLDFLENLSYEKTQNNAFSLPKTQKTEHYYYFEQIIDALHTQKKEIYSNYQPQKPPAFVLLLDNVELALEKTFWQDFLWAFSPKKHFGADNEQFFVCPSGEKLPIPPNFYVLCALTVSSQDFVQKAFLYDYALVQCDLDNDFIENAVLRKFAFALNTFISRENSEIYCLGRYFFEGFLMDFQINNQTHNNEKTAFPAEYILSYIFDFHIFPYLKSIFSHFSLQKLSHHLQIVGIDTILENDRLQLSPQINEE